MNWFMIERWLGRGLWIFLAVVSVTLFLVPKITGVSPVGGYSDTLLFFSSIAVLSLFVSLITLR